MIFTRRHVAVSNGADGQDAQILCYIRIPHTSKFKILYIAIFITNGTATDVRYEEKW